MIHEDAPCSLKRHFSRFLAAEPDRLHFAAHSHHLWPDVTHDAHLAAWEDAAARWDAKWDVVFGELVPDVQSRIAGVLGLSRPGDVAFAPNTHELVVRLLSAWDGSGRTSPTRILTTDAEFHSFRRQTRRLVEAGLAELDVVPAEPFDTFDARFGERAASGEHDLVFVSQVFFNSGFVVRDLTDLVRSVPRPEAVIAIDGYHGFMALPTDLAAIEDRAFYLAGGYKYAMAGEGCCFLHCPPGHVERPVNTGWFAGFDELEASADPARVSFGADGTRMLGSTFDPSGLYRLRAVLRWLEEVGIEVADVHARVARLQRLFLERLDRSDLPWLADAALLPDRSAPDRGHFLTFRTRRAAELHAALARVGIVTDHRGDRLRFGFGLYHDDEDVERLFERMGALGIERG